MTRANERARDRANPRPRVARMNEATSDYLKVYGWSTERALIFTGVVYGRSPMIAVRVHPLKPATVIYHKPGRIDPLALKLADKEGIPLVVTALEKDKLIKNISNL